MGIQTVLHRSCGLIPCEPDSAGISSRCTSWEMTSRFSRSSRCWRSGPGGNPFFLEESVRCVRGAGALAGAPGAYRLAGLAHGIQVPSTVQPVIAARIDRLSPAHKQLLQAAAVIGTTVPVPLLHAIAELADEALRQGLAIFNRPSFCTRRVFSPSRVYVQACVDP